MLPVSPATALGMIESGYSADIVLRLLVKSINGVRSESGRTANVIPAHRDFYPLLDNLRALQDSGALSIRLVTRENTDALLLILKSPGAMEDETLAAKSREVRKILGLGEGINQYRVVYGSTRAAEDELSLLTRSFLEILTDISTTVEVPEIDIAEQRVTPTLRTEGEGFRPPMIKIACSDTEPVDAFVSVPYRGRWFSISDREYVSKKIFSFLMFIMTLTETGSNVAAPVMTISTGG